ncbi:MAG TPA: apolipoprotein N-acyltransferase [Acidimicrobiales bacterium]|nr:apolipoprotein N-acyltransferase [Acidimicrobiales bacterium]
MGSNARQQAIKRLWGLALLSGVLSALSLPPWGAWPFAFVGLGLLYTALEGKPWRRRLLIGWIAGLGHFGIGLFWMLEFTLPGGIIAILGSALFVGAAAVLVPAAGPWRRALAFPCALLLLEAARVRFPFGGVPPGGLALGQAGGPLAPAARIGGPLVLVALTALAGVATAQAGRRIRTAAVAVIVAIPLLGVLAPAGGSAAGDPVRVGIVQGGGRRGFRAVDSDPGDVYDAHLAATDLLQPPLDLIVWPENVIDVDGNVADTTVADDMAAIARRFNATVVSGVVEGEGTDRFRNLAVAWAPDGRIVGRYDKVHRVPFGEWVPFRSLVDKIADLSDVPNDAIAGHKPNVLATPAGRLGVAISYEVFFPDRGREATNRGASMMLVPTNASSFKTSQVPTQEVAATRLLAIASGRTVVQAAPTGYSAVVTPDGRVRARTVLGRRQVLRFSVTRHVGRTIYARLGDWPWLLLSLAGILTARSRRRKAV